MAYVELHSLAAPPSLKQSQKYRMRLDALSEDWDELGAQDPTQKHYVTNLLGMMADIRKGLNPNDWAIHKNHMLVDGIYAEIMDKHTGIFYDLTIKQKNDTVKVPPAK